MKYIIIIILIIIILFLINYEIHENLVITDSTYSNCKVGCIIACTKKDNSLYLRCYNKCVENCWNY